MIKKKSKQFGTFTTNGIEYYRTRIKDQDGKRITLYAKTVDELSEKVAEVKEQIENADKFKLTNLKKQFQEITTNAKAMGITSETIFEKIFGMFGKLSSMIFGGSFLIFAVNSLKKIYNNILSIDSALVNVKKVTDETDQTYQRLISDTLQPGEDYVDGIIRVYNDDICEVIDNYNSSAFYEPSYVIARAYQNGGF